MTPSDLPTLSAEDRKLVTLAKATRARIGAAQGAAVRDLDGRTYAAASVALASLQLSAVQVAVAMAIAAGSRGLEAVVLLADDPQWSDQDRGCVAEFCDVSPVIHLGDPRGLIARSLAGDTRG